MDGHQHSRQHEDSNNISNDESAPSFAPVIWLPPPGQPAHIKLPSVITGDSLETFLTYIYTNRYSPPNPSDPPSPVRSSEKKEIMYSVSIPPALRTPPRILVELYTLAKFYEISELTNLVAKDLVKRIDSNTVWEILECANVCEPYSDHIKTMAEVYIKKHSLSPPGNMNESSDNIQQRTRIDRRPAKRIARRPGDDDEVVI